MPKKKLQLDQKLDPGMQSWEAQAGQSLRAETQEPEQEPEEKDLSEKLQRKTFLVTQALIDRINRVATTHSVGQNEMVRYLLDWSLEQVESGQHALPLRPRYTIDH
jgi:hypothetical protein